MCIQCKPEFDVIEMSQELADGIMMQSAISSAVLLLTVAGRLEVYY
jgi:hypothetical protein